MSFQPGLQSWFLFDSTCLPKWAKDSFYTHLQQKNNGICEIKTSHWVIGSFWVWNIQLRNQNWENVAKQKYEENLFLNYVVFECKRKAVVDLRDLMKIIVLAYWQRFEVKLFIFLFYCYQRKKQIIDLYCGIDMLGGV